MYAFMQAKASCKKSAFIDAILMITGGTGSFGYTVLKHFLTSDIGVIRIFPHAEIKA